MNNLEKHYHAVVVGGGFFGCHLAHSLSQSGKKVLLVEKESTLMSRASYTNQARVHGGYHYPRSIVTGLRSQANYKLFLKDFEECIQDEFKKYYAISSKFSKVNAQQFKLFCQRIEAPLKSVPKDVKQSFNPDLVEEVFEVEECAFDSHKLRDKMIDLLDQKNIKVSMGTTVTGISKEITGHVVTLDSNGEIFKVSADETFICVYSKLNNILSSSKLPIIPLRHELTEMVLVEPPEFLKNAGVTMMCGPFFSVMPFPSRNLHSFSHVRYTPHFSWADEEQNEILDFELRKDQYNSNYIRMKKDAERFIPALSECKYIDSLWEVKTVLPRNEQDDARPILYRKDHGLSGLSCIIGGKIDNVFDVYNETPL